MNDISNVTFVDTEAKSYGCNDLKKPQSNIIIEPIELTTSTPPFSSNHSVKVLSRAWGLNHQESFNQGTISG